ncbi:MAG: APC family permease [Haloarculaceae archaeon]
MASDGLGLFESVSMALGGMIGGGIFAVLGVVASTSGTAAWMAFVAAGVIALCSGAANIALNDELSENGGPITYIQRFTERTTLAGMAGWTFTVGYVGTSAMYAYAFGSYLTELVGLHAVAGVPARPIVSAAVVATFVGLNVLGAHASGRTEDVLVGLKVAILVVFALAGLYYGFVSNKLTTGFGALGVGPLIAAAISFVAFEGWELLLYDQDSIRDPKATVRKAIYISVVSATVLYALIAVVTTDLLTPAQIQQHAETALAIASEPFFGQLGFALISVAALFSTGSAINATLFSTARFTSRMAEQDLLPDKLDRSSGDGEPVRELLVVGLLAAAFTVAGSLQGITSFASLTFIVIMGGMNYLAITQRDSTDLSVVVPIVGLAGTLITIPLLLWHLYSAEFGVFLTVAGIAVAVIAVELLYFERDWVESEVDAAESAVLGPDESLPPETD